MPYVKRGPAQEIISVSQNNEAGAQEFVDPNDSELALFLENMGIKDGVQRDLVQTDLEMSRVIEDLVDTMIRKNQLLLTDLPGEAQQKLMKRQKLRGRLNDLVGLVSEDDIL